MTSMQTTRRPIRSASSHALLHALLLASIALASPGVVSAQQPQGMPSEEMMKRLQDPEAMQRMVAQMDEMQKCMEKIDQKELDALQKRAESASKEIEALCKAGKKDRALARAMELADEMRSDATVKQVRECTKDVEDIMQSMPMGAVPGVTDDSEPNANELCG